MKYLIIIFFLCSNSIIFANESNEFFSPAERAEIIRSIDNACGDTWCAGDYNFKFNNFSCDKTTKSCDLSFHFIKNDEDSVEIYSPVQVCHFENIRSFKQIKDSNFSLNYIFYGELNECIGILERSVHF